MKNKSIFKFALVILLLLVFLNCHMVKATDVEPTIDETEGQTSSGETGDNTTEEIPESQAEWADFSNAVFELKRVKQTKINLEISGVTEPTANSWFYLLITYNNNTLNVDDFTEDNSIVLSHTTDGSALLAYQMEKYVELNKDLYANILEYHMGTSEKKVVASGIKLDRPTESKYFDAFYATFVSHDSNQIVTNFIHSAENDRNMQIKVGKITDTSILKKIKDKNSTGFSDLLKFAQSNTGIYDKIVSADHDSELKYSAGSAGKDTGHSLIDLPGLVNEEYYYLYIKTDDENGKYISNEAVTLAQANVYESQNAWYLFFYGSADFNWTDFEEEPINDPTVATGELPNTGIQLIWVIFGLVAIVGGTITFIQFKKNNY